MYKVSKKSDTRWSYWWFILIKHVGTESWFYDNFSRIVGNGIDTKFWLDKWIGGECLKNIFPRPFAIDTNPLCSVADKFITIDEKRMFRGNWRRPLYSWEEEQVQKLLLETEVNLKTPTVEDHWTWKLSKNGCYSAKSAYLELDRRKSDDSASSAALGIVWNKNVPLKISAFSWKLLQDRVPTMWNLLQRGAFNPNYSLKCRVCGKFDEDTNHLFFYCGQLQQFGGKCNSGSILEILGDNMVRIIWMDLFRLLEVITKMWPILFGNTPFGTYGLEEMQLFSPARA
ncbi:hypothetical protein ACS0TY_007127 [Phlomoides rotata]